MKCPLSQIRSNIGTYVAIIYLQFSYYYYYVH
jgi:hypothetical protein